MRSPIIFAQLSTSHLVSHAKILAKYRQHRKKVPKINKQLQLYSCINCRSINVRVSKQELFFYEPSSDVGRTQSRLI